MYKERSSLKRELVNWGETVSVRRGSVRSPTSHRRILTPRVTAEVDTDEGWRDWGPRQMEPGVWNGQKEEREKCYIIKYTHRNKSKKSNLTFRVLQS